MTYLPQFLIIMTVSLLGELLQRLIPLPIPASVYGIVLLFGALCCKIVKVDQVKKAGNFLVSLLPLLFVSPVASLLDSWPVVKDALVPLLGLTVVSTLLTFLISGKTAQWFLRKEDRDGTSA